VEREWWVEPRSGFVALTCPPEAERAAARAMSDRDGAYREGSPYQPADTDAPWVGHLGEMVFFRFLADWGVPATWLRADPLHEPDFRTAAGTVDCKTAKRMTPPRPEWTCGVSTRQLYRAVDWYAFLTYEVGRRRMWLLGMIAKPDFMARARHLAAGERVHEAYVVRAGNEISNLPMRELVRPMEWTELYRTEAPA
jgi:hypothetical protein